MYNDKDYNLARFIASEEEIKKEQNIARFVAFNKLADRLDSIRADIKATSAKASQGGCPELVEMGDHIGELIGCVRAIADYLAQI